MHIHNCRRKQLAYTLERLQSELKHCFACFDWFVEEEWGQHCQTHLKSITSKLRGSVIHCHCMGNNRLPISSRWTSWTREAKSWSHLQSHLEASRWPLECPHPLCSLQLHDETLFLYHLSDVHSLQVSPIMNKCRPTGSNSKPLINCTPEMASHKQKTQDRDRQDLRPSKRTKGPLQIKGGNVQCPEQSLDRKTSDTVQATPSPESSETSTTRTATDDDPQDLPELIHSESILSPDTGELHSMDNLCLSQDVLQKELHKVASLSWLRGLPEINPGEHKPPPNEDTLFSQYLPSRSPSCFSAQRIGSNYDSDGKTYS